MVEFWGFLRALVLRAEREEREGLSEGGGEGPGRAGSGSTWEIRLTERKTEHV